MKRTMYSFPIKTTAFIVSFFTLAITVAGVFCVVFMLDTHFYISSEKEVYQNFLGPMLSSERNDIIHKIENGNTSVDELKADYAYSNVLYEIIDEENGMIYSNYNGENHIVYSSNRVKVIYRNNDGFEIFTDDSQEFYDETSDEISDVRYYDVKLYLDDNLAAKDHYYYYAKAINLAYSMRFSVFIIILIAFALTLTLWIYLINVSCRKDKNEVTLNYFDKIPFDLYVCILALIVALPITVVYESYDAEMELIFTIISCISAYCAFMAFILSLSTRIKKGVLFYNTIIAKILLCCKRLILTVAKYLGHILSNINLVWKIAALSVIIACLEIFTLIVFQYEIGLILVLAFLFNIIMIPLIILIGIMLMKLKNGGERLASGDVSAQIDTSRMFGDFRKFGETLNNIGDGLQNAVDERMKSERMKTELITNVSHDIKTPLTSIINYVDLIKKEEIDNEKAIEYIDVLDRQSNRLKKLIEDLVEASKASTGALKIDPRPCDVGVLLSQAAGEYSEKFESNSLEVILNIPENPVAIMADGRYLWRVFDNLFNNICKYALKNTRVYLDLSVIDKKAIITFRNISSSPLNISSEELMERFVRGDSSRNTEGSGLGLSIAKSLTELQKGSLELYIDGDLFKAVIVFDKI